MRNNLETFKIWAPDDSLWTEWVKPVLFINVPRKDKIELVIPETGWIGQMDPDTMLIIDLPAQTGIEESLALARLGYRPVPLYNGVYGPNNSAMIVKVEDIVTALYKGAGELAAAELRSDAPPAFLLDSNRMKGAGKQPGKYDNRWCVFPQDMPSAAFLSVKGIRKIIVRSDTVQNDLAHILRRYQEQGIKIYQCKDGEMVKEITAVKPSRFKSLFYRFEVIAGLTRNGAGGFGGKIPEATQSSSGGRYYGLG